MEKLYSKLIKEGCNIYEKLRDYSLEVCSSNRISKCCYRILLKLIKLGVLNIRLCCLLSKKKRIEGIGKIWIDNTVSIDFQIRKINF